MTKVKWIALIDGEVCNAFDSREDAVKWLIGVIKRELRDLRGQDRPNSGYDYSIILRKIEIKPVKPRPTYLGR